MNKIECIGGFADGEKFEAVIDGKMVLYHAKNGEHREQMYIEHDGLWWQLQLFVQLDHMQNYEWSVGGEN